MSPFRDEKSWVSAFIIVTRNGDSLETLVVLIEISVMLEFTEWPKTPGITFLQNFKTLLSLMGIVYLQVIFVLIWMKQTQFTKRWNWKWIF